MQAAVIALCFRTDPYQ